MRNATVLIFTFAMMAGSQALADTRYMFCFGGGQVGLYYSAVFPVPQGTKGADKANAFNAFVKSKYGTMIFSECHIDLSQASANSDKKIREDSDQTSKFPSKLFETRWAGT